MTLDEAIEHNKEVKKMMLKAGRYHPEKAESIQVGIEALERLEEVRDILDTNLVKSLLPSETE